MFFKVFTFLVLYVSFDFTQKNLGSVKYVKLRVFLVRIFPYKGIIYDSVIFGKMQLMENQYSDIFHAAKLTVISIYLQYLLLFLHRYCDCVFYSFGQPKKS